MSAFQSGQVALEATPVQVQLPVGHYSLLLTVVGTSGDYAYVGGSSGVSSATGFPVAAGSVAQLTVSIATPNTTMWVVGTSGDTLGWMIGS